MHLQQLYRNAFQQHPVYPNRLPNIKHPLVDPATKFCTGQERLSRSVYKQESKIQFIYDAVYALAIAWNER
jgi:hypothetical protein